MPRLVIEWTPAGDPDQDEALVDQIVERTVDMLAARAPIVHGELAFDPYAA
jgi:hypothetical protein